MKWWGQVRIQKFISIKEIFGRAQAEMKTRLKNSITQFNNSGKKEENWIPGLDDKVEALEHISKGYANYR